MRIHRLYHPDLTTTTGTINLDRDASRYLLQVLRVKPGQQLQLFNGHGMQCDACLERADKNSAVVSLQACHSLDHESPLSVQLALGISKGDRMDVAIQKAVELGVTHIQPVQTEFSVVRLSADRAEKRLRHWQGIIISACEQSGRNTLPMLLPVQTYEQWLAQERNTACWLFHPQGTQRLSEIPRPEQGVTILIGPEGGLAEHEIKAARSQGFAVLSFGPRILRTETAAIACISAIQALWGDLA